jgi:hypothetical protein
MSSWDVCIFLLHLRVTEVLPDDTESNLICHTAETHCTGRSKAAVRSPISSFLFLLYTTIHLKTATMDHLHHTNTTQYLMQTLVAQLVHGCKQPDCKNSYCATGLRNSTDIPVRDYTPRSARILALETLGRSDPDAHLCQLVKSGGKIPTPDTDAGPRDPSSLAQRLADTSCMKILAEGETPPGGEHSHPDLEKATEITAKLRAQCEPPLDASGSLNPRFAPSEEVADTVASAWTLFYSLLPKQSEQRMWQSAAYCINNGQVLPAQTLEPDPNNASLIELLQIFQLEPYTRMCAQICRVIALRTQVEDVAAKFRPAGTNEIGSEDILTMLAERVTDIARRHTAYRKNTWVPWPYPLWFKNTFLQHWDGKPTVTRGTIACGALELLEMQQEIWDRSNPTRASDANLLPHVYNRTDATEVLRSWMKRDHLATTTQRHLLSFPFLYSDSQVLMNFRTLNHLRMRYGKHTNTFLDSETLTTRLQRCIHRITRERGALRSSHCEQRCSKSGMG